MSQVKLHDVVTNRHTLYTNLSAKLTMIEERNKSIGLMHLHRLK